MSKTTEVGITKSSTLQVAALVAGIKNAAADAVRAGAASGTQLDSATHAVAGGAEFLGEAVSRGDIKVPETVQIAMDEFGKAEYTKAILDSAHAYEHANGCAVSADLMEQAIHNAYAQTLHARNEFKLDSAFSTAHDPLSIQPNRAVMAFYATVAEATPWAMYLPADLRSNQAKLAIVSHNAVGATGAYAEGALLDGAFAGQAFISSMRVHKAFPDAEGKLSFKITGVQETADTCLQTIDGAPTLRGRGEVYINGELCAIESRMGGSGASAVNGEVTIAGQKYVIGGVYNCETGAAALTTTPALPTTVPVYFEAPINFERAPQLSAVLGTSVEVFDLYANPWRARTRVSPDARGQMANELGLDPLSEAMVAIQRQYTIERHYRALALARRAAEQNTGTYNFEWASRSSDMLRSRIWSDFGAQLGLQSQKMVEDTMDHGITHLYTGKDVKSQWEALPRDIFEPSGVEERPGIYRYGKLFGKYDCYYTPRGVSETNTSAEILAVGRATNSARNPVVFGDSHAPTVKNLQAGDDQNEGMSFYARDFTAANPHRASAKGAALITVTNMR